MAGVCSVCVAASSGSVNPPPKAPQPVSTAVPAVSRPYALTALSFPVALINVASLPLQNVIQIANALSGLTSIVIATPNKVS